MIKLEQLLELSTEARQVYCRMANESFYNKVYDTCQQQHKPFSKSEHMRARFNNSTTYQFHVDCCPTAEQSKQLYDMLAATEEIIFICPAENKCIALVQNSTNNVVELYPYSLPREFNDTSQVDDLSQA